MSKYVARKRRGLKTKHVQNASNKPRLVVFRSGRHIYAQVLVKGEKGTTVLAQASTVCTELRTKLSGSKVEHAVAVGQLVAERAAKMNVKEVAFDRNGYKYHGRVKALADSARANGLVF